ncbi:hypothetical protein Acr_29g0005690 [Actinidia rufa]|uniref:PLAC8 family protein n=1 Tax=Actinidia rufa TaxID=165716 RepID=A0A7J0HE52_9ERIC|nr:hypothetical protein Acr_29g0005690 [Actinidia rufa]
MSQNNTYNANTKSSDPNPQVSYPLEGQWSTGLYDCWDDPSTCLIASCFPCITMGRIVEMIDKGSTSCFVGGLIFCALNPKCFGKLYAYSYRSKLRALFSLPEAQYSDAFVSSCCCVCALTQEYRELKNRGFNPSIGENSYF